MPSRAATASAVTALSPVTMTRSSPRRPQLPHRRGGRRLHRVGHPRSAPRAGSRPRRTPPSDLRGATRRRARRTARRRRRRPFRAVPACRASPRVPRPYPAPRVRSPPGNRPPRARSGRGASAARTIASARGCSLPRSRAAAIRSNSASPARSAGRAAGVNAAAASDRSGNSASPARLAGRAAGVNAAAASDRSGNSASPARLAGENSPRRGGRWRRRACGGGPEWGLGTVSDAAAPSASPVTHAGIGGDDRRHLRTAFRQGGRSLSTMRVSTRSRVSRASAFLMRTPAPAPRPVPTMTAIGVASPRAHGHAMTRTATLLTRARGEPRLGTPERPGGEGQPRHNHHRGARTRKATRSASRWIGARLRCASPTMATICASSGLGPDALGPHLAGRRSRSGSLRRPARPAPSRPAWARRSTSTRRWRWLPRRRPRRRGPFRRGGSAGGRRRRPRRAARPPRGAPPAPGVAGDPARGGRSETPARPAAPPRSGRRARSSRTCPSSTSTTMTTDVSKYGSTPLAHPESRGEQAGRDGRGHAVGVGRPHAEGDEGEPSVGAAVDHRGPGAGEEGPPRPPHHRRCARELHPVRRGAADCGQDPARPSSISAMARAKTGKPTKAAHRNRRVMSSSSGVGGVGNHRPAVSRAMPHFGQLPRPPLAPPRDAWGTCTQRWAAGHPRPSPRRGPMPHFGHNPRPELAHPRAHGGKRTRSWPPCRPAGRPGARRRHLIPPSLPMRTPDSDPGPPSNFSRQPAQQK